MRWLRHKLGEYRWPDIALLAAAAIAFLIGLLTVISGDPEEWIGVAIMCLAVALVVVWY